MPQKSAPTAETFQPGEIDPAEPHSPAEYLGNPDRHATLDKGPGKADAAEYLKRWRRDADGAGLDLPHGAPFEKQDAQSLLCREQRREHPHRPRTDHQDVRIGHSSSSCDIPIRPRFPHGFTIQRCIS